MTALRHQKTKIVGTVGPASDSQEMLERLIDAGLNIVRLNFAHGDHASHAEVVKRVRMAAAGRDRRVAILGDLPGPKMRIGKLDPDPVCLIDGAPFCLTTRMVVGDESHASLSFDALPNVVSPGDKIFLNDGFIQLNVERIEGTDVHTVVAVGGELRSNKGVNFPGIDLGVSAFTEQDHEHLRFAKEMDLDAVSQSFVRSADDIRTVRRAAQDLDFDPLLIAKIERAEAIDHIEDILDEADGIMVARGDLGVEIPIEDVAPIQKRLIRAANLVGKPVITATQMLESMTQNSRPTRAEATDVANAIFDGTDCVMLSGETATGRYPTEAVATMRRIAERTEPLASSSELVNILERAKTMGWLSKEDLTPFTAFWLARELDACALVVPTKDGRTPRRMSRFRPQVWVLAVASDEEMCRKLEFSYGVHGVVGTKPPAGWVAYVRTLLTELGINGDIAVLVRTAAGIEDGYSSHFDIVDLKPGTADLRP